MSILLSETPRNPDLVNMNLMIFHATGLRLNHDLKHYIRLLLAFDFAPQVNNA